MYHFFIATVFETKLQHKNMQKILKFVLLHIAAKPKLKYLNMENL